ncbi:hypothetical protein BS47DRAFT_1345672 [Hydnum rufescens UP504]|uniref:Uncharacterized protein n=1 Tax=Hydnum rufescens UP504 TaxID=1448309 RepID=A0A9P6AUL9_9AGAM|nr:hypothetical protein BS47DRAFT_1345672 [Hydnum rufescens UP504]
MLQWTSENPRPPRSLRFQSTNHDIPSQRIRVSLTQDPFQFDYSETQLDHFPDRHQRPGVGKSQPIIQEENTMVKHSCFHLLARRNLPIPGISKPPRIVSQPSCLVEGVPLNWATCFRNHQF